VYGGWAVSKTKDGGGAEGVELLKRAGMMVTARRSRTGRSWYKTEEFPCCCPWGRRGL